MNSRALIKYSFSGFLMLLILALTVPSTVEYGVAVVLGIAMLYTTNNLKIKFSWGFLLAVIFSISYFVLDTFVGYSAIRAIAYGVTISALYLYGLNWGNRLSEDDYEKYILFSIKVVYYGLSFYIIGCMIYSFLRGFTVSMLSRDPYQMWNGTIGNSTHFGTLSAVPLAIAMLDMFCLKASKGKALSVVIFVGVFVANLMMANRIVFIFAAAFLIVAAFLRYRNEGFSRQLKFLIGLAFFILIVFTAYDVNLLNIKSALAQLPVFRRIQTLDAIGYEDPRLERQIYVLQHFFDYMHGGGHYNALVGEVHNVWLDVYDYAGLLPFMAFIVFSVITVMQAISRVKSGIMARASSYLAMILFAFMLSFAEEPVMRTCESYFTLFFFMSGVLCSACRKSKSYFR